MLLILGSLIIGFLASDKQAEGIQPFTNDLFKGFLAIFLLAIIMIRRIMIRRKHRKRILEELIMR